MRISTKGRYGIRLMLSLAINYKNGHMSLKEIARSQEISEKYLEQIINPLTKAGYVMSYRGSQGGYSLNFPPEQISIGEILRVLEGSLSPVECTDNGSVCTKSTQCITISLWQKIKEAVESVVDHTTLEDLVKEYNEKNEINYII